MTEKEELMYHLLAKMSNADVPLIFKGGLITNLVLSENNYNSIRRATVDIDANWIDDPPTMEALVNTIQNSLGEMSDYFIVKPFREYGEKRSAGLQFYDREQNKIFSMDIEIKPALSSRTYYFGEASFQGILPTEIVSDKVCAVSSDSVYKHRTKDLVDIYALAKCMQIKTQEVYDFCDRKGKEIQDFSGFLEKTDLLEHAYNKLQRIEQKPSFYEVYDYTSYFLEPFIQNDRSEKIWSPQDVLWQDLEKNKCKNADYPDLD